MRLFLALLMHIIFASVALAQDQGAAPPAAAATDAAEAAPEADGPALPPTVVAPDIRPEVLQLRLVPLTKAELEEAAKAWLDIVKAKTSAVSEAMVAVAEAGDDVPQARREELNTLIAERKSLFDNYAKVISAWSLKGGDPATIAEYRAYQNAVFVDEVRTSDFRTLFNRAVDWLVDPDGGVEILIDVLVVVFAILALVIAARIVQRVARRGIGRIPNLSKLLQAFLLVAIYWLTIAFGLMVVLSALGVDITPLFAVVGGASFILAFALQDTLGNLAAGLMIMINRPFDEGDYVDIAGTAGTVNKVNIVSTTITTPDNQIIIVPNGKVWGNIITNVTGSTQRRVDLVFGIGYGDSVEKAQQLFETIVAEHPLCLADPAPTIRVHALSESSVDFVVRPWVKSADYWTVYWDLTRAVKERCDAAGISIPYPQRDIHVHQVGAAVPQAAQ